jgi:membrane-bound lytic murein transglycosylase F
LTLEDPTSYYESPNGPAGLEFELTDRFANWLGVSLKIEVVRGYADLLAKIQEGDAHLAAAGLAVTDEQSENVRFGPDYQTASPQLVYRSDTPKPAGIEDLDEGVLEVPAGSSHAALLRSLRQDFPDLRWTELPNTNTQDLVDLVAEKMVDYTVLDSHEVALKQRFFPDLQVAFDLGDPRPLAWAFPRGDDDSLIMAAEAFFGQLEASGELADLLEHYYGHIDQLDYVSVYRFKRRLLTRLRQYQSIFQQAARETNWDWRLLAAVGYQESHWLADAKSPTGVRGLMMLTQVTAEQVGVSDRLDPEQSIMGGAHYLRQIESRLPDHVTEPDRTWLTLAAYNVGLGHLEDAQKLALDGGADPHSWVELKRFLPLLREKRWYKKTRYGFARGDEPVHYVENIRSYYEILVWQTDQDESVPTLPGIEALSLDLLGL